MKRFPFLGWFDWTVVSGREGVTASTLGIKTVRFRSSRQLRADLEALGFWLDLSPRRAGATVAAYSSGSPNM